MVQCREYACNIYVGPRIVNSIITSRIILNAGTKTLLNTP